VRLIDAEGNQFGVVELSSALLKAEDAGLDLVEISPNAEPPVCKILDYGKYKYEQEKKLQKSKKSQKNQEIKGIRLSVKIGQNDFDTKLRKAQGFIEKGSKLQLQLRFKGREMAHRELGEKVLRSFVEALGEVTVEQEPKMLGRGMNMVVAPRKK
jgi:translation initiation factor IF-3